MNTRSKTRELEEKYEQPKKVYILEVKNAKGESELMRSIMFDRGDLTINHKQKFTIFKKLLKEGNPNSKDYAKNTVASVAIVHLQYKMLKKLLRKGADVKEPSGKTRNLIIHDILHMCFDTPKRKKLISKDRRRYVVYMFKYAIKYGVDMNKINTHSETGVSLLEKLEKLENAEEVKKIRSIYMKSLLKGEVDSEETNESNREEARKISTCEEDEGELDSEGLGQTFTKQEIDMEIREELENEEMSNGEVVEDLTETSFEDCCTTIQNEENNGNSQIPAGCENVCSDSKVTSILVKRSATAPPFDHVYQRSFTDAPEIENPIFDLPEVNQPKRDPPQEIEISIPQLLQEEQSEQKSLPESQFQNVVQIPELTSLISYDVKLFTLFLDPITLESLIVNQSSQNNMRSIETTQKECLFSNVNGIQSSETDALEFIQNPNTLHTSEPMGFQQLDVGQNFANLNGDQPIQIPPVPVIPSASLYAPNLIPQLNFINPPSLPISNPVFNLPSQPGFFNTQF
ncbi:Protein CBG25286 [Caenorhabditis briggsae]|uniref:Protein CBG25286 n=1 Tax=Caenorhabditis briggsae TaxID=6238 RepID=B6IF33_CAEBR|nr:Protein CBG25286 [Caenorhabditis briggsae]CAR98513.1 Protein CBG25286 [Caenorhabditis briggsae]